jgi:hypothetical protein
MVNRNMRRVSKSRSKNMMGSARKTRGMRGRKTRGMRMYGGEHMIDHKNMMNDESMMNNGSTMMGGRGKTRNGMRGGGAADYELSVVGDVSKQFSNVMDIGGPSYGNLVDRSSNAIIGTAGQGLTSSSVIPTDSQLKLVQSAGGKYKKKNKSKNKRKKGGFFGNVITQAVVPFSILGLQQTYRKKNNNKTSKKRRKR